MPPRKSTSSTAAAADAPSTPASRSATPSKPRSRTRSTGASSTPRRSSSTASAKRTSSSSSSSSKAKLVLSEHVYLTYASYAFAVITIAFGINAILDPKEAIKAFAIDYPSLIPKQQLTVDVLSAIYGLRDIYIGATILIATIKGTRKSLAYTVLAVASTALLDGLVCFAKVGKGYWIHWSWFPLALGVGVLLMGCFDK